MPIEIQEATSQQPQGLAGVLLSMMRVGLKRWTTVGTTAAVIVSAASLTAVILPNLYTATAVILPPQQSGSAGAAMMAQLGSLGSMASLAGGLGIKNPNDLQVALLKSQSVENAIVSRYHLQALYRRRYLSTARKRWERATTIDNGLKDGLIRLSVTDRDPRLAAEMANGWVEEYRRFSSSLAVSEASQRRLFFERQLAGARESLERAEEEMKQTEQQTGVIEMDGQAHAMIASAAALRAQVAAKQVEIQAMREYAAEQNPDLERARQELQALAGQLAAMDVVSDRRGGDLVAPRGKLSEASVAYARALRELKYREMVEQLLSRQCEIARVDEARQGSLVQVVDAASIPDRPNSLYRIWIVLVAALASLPTALMIALCAELASILRLRRRQAGSWYLALQQSWQGGAR